MTYAEARQKAVDAGFQGEPPPEVVKQFGWEPGNPLADVEISPSVVTEEQLNLHLAKLEEEAKANNVPTQIIKGLRSVVGMAIKFLP